MEDVTVTKILCSQCNTEINSEAKFCTHCGYPENGDEKEKAKFHANKVMQKNKGFNDAKKIKSARNTLYWMAGIFLVSGLFLFFTLNDITILVANLILVVVYLILAYWSKQKPFAALLSALLLFLMVIALNTVLDPSSLFKGILIKIILLSFLIKGVYSASPNAKR
ncbi:zinc ribbon domain-containing protein [Aquimarina mytili]|uniref:Zinc ribbon domain-containing protein n=1 Tax=Aquimarina mytili TaxID=874423 RepID=A0A936ZQH7_9FLAO|nr:zinc ribbon domain-containing protein [Aquimarina mytili]MBL0683819.1 zinc ribbon domain-containing protein [Aquimarina mytili]